MKKRKSKTKKGRSPSMAARVKKLIEHADDTAREISSLKQRVSDLENAEPEPEPIPEPAKTEAAQTIV